MVDLVHVTIGGGGSLFGSAAILTRTRVGRVPIPPVMRGVRLLVLSVVLFRLVKQFSQRCDIHGWRRLLLPFAAGKARRDFLHQPTVPVRILERREGEVGTTFRVGPRDARVLCRVVEGPPSVMENLADADAAADQILAGSGHIVHSQDQLRRAGAGRRDSLAEMIDASESGGVNCKTRNFSSAA